MNKNKVKRMPIHTPEAIKICRMLLRWGKIISEKNTMFSREEIIDQYAAEIDALRPPKLIPKLEPSKQPVDKPKVNEILNSHITEPEIT